jgi:hypothetical protein
MLRLLLIPLLMITVTACSQNLDPTTPDGAMREFAKSFAYEKHDLLYERLTNKTHQNLKDLIVLFQKRLKLASTYPSAQQKWAKKDLENQYDGINDGKALFMLILKDEFDLLKGKPAEEIEQYFNAKSVHFNAEDASKAYIFTRTKDRIDLLLEDGIWKISTFEGFSKRLLDETQETIETMDKNLKEIKRRQDLNLSLPTSN